MQGMLLTFAALLLVACGGTPSSYDLCSDACDVGSRCGQFSSAMLEDCRVNCQSRKDAFDAQDSQDQSNCKNYSTWHNLVSGCYGRNCSEIAGCLASVDTQCVPK